MSVCQAVYYDPVGKEVHGEQKPERVIDERGFGWILFEAMKKWKDAGLTAQIDASTGLNDSYADLLRRCIRTAMAMKEIGVRKGDIITICSYNHLNAIVPYVASHFVGAIPAPTDPTLSVDDTQHLLNLVKPKLVFASAGAEALIDKSLKGLEFECKIVSFAEQTEKYQSFDWFLREQKGEEQFEPEICADPNDTCLILFSSGTTGLPKGICLNHRFIMNCVHGMESIEDTVYLGYATLYWISAIMIVNVCLCQGHKRLTCPSFQPELIWEYVDAYNVEFVFLAPVQAIKIISHLSDKGKGLKNLMIGGGSIAPTYLQQLRDHFPDSFVASGYGQTEVGFISGLNEKDRNYDKKQTCGQPYPGLTVKIVDPDSGEALGLQRLGEIRVKTKYNMNGYYNRDSSDVWDADGYVKTGDLGYFDADMCLFVTDRIKEMFKYMSWHIVPAKLEMILQSHPDVQLAVVIGVPHPTEDNHALGIVTLAHGACVSAKELELFVEKQVDDRNKLRAGVLIFDAANLPMTPTGKIKRRELKETIAKLIRIRA